MFLILKGISYSMARQSWKNLLIPTLIGLSVNRYARKKCAWHFHAIIDCLITPEDVGEEFEILPGSFLATDQSGASGACSSWLLVLHGWIQNFIMNIDPCKENCFYEKFWYISKYRNIKQPYVNIASTETYEGMI